MSDPCTILLVDDHPAWNDLLRVYLSATSHLVVMDSVGSRQDARAAIEKGHPKLLVVDIQLSDGCGIELGKIARQIDVPIYTLVLTAYDEDFYMVQALDNGALGYVLKTEDTETIITSIQRAARGEALWTGYQLLRIDYWRKRIGDKWLSLSEREREVLNGLSHLKTDEKIAEELSISTRTVHHHVSHILQKLAAEERVHVGRFPLRIRSNTCGYYLSTDFLSKCDCPGFCDIGNRKSHKYGSISRSHHQF